MSNEWLIELMFETWIQERIGHVSWDKRKELFKEFLNGKVIMARSTGESWVVPEQS